MEHYYYTACLKNVTTLILNNFNKPESISLIFLHIVFARFFTKNQLYFLIETPVNLLYLAISQSDVNDVLLLRHLLHRS